METTPFWRSAVAPSAGASFGSTASTGTGGRRQQEFSSPSGPFQRGVARSPRSARGGAADRRESKMRRLILIAGLVAAVAVPAAANASVGWTHDAFRNSTSSNWSGYSAIGAASAFTSVSASWIQPMATCGFGQTAASFWVGLDGDGSQTVEQIGTYSNCTSANVPQYYAWFEMYPSPAYKTSLPVSPGDRMSASVSVDKVGRFNLSITNSTRGWTASSTQRSTTAAFASAEVIAEAPS